MGFVSKITLPNASSYDLKDKLANVYAICNTEADVAEKALSITNFEVLVGQTIHVLFVYANSTAAPALKINSLAAQPIFLNNDNVSPWNGGDTVALTWDGQYWRLNDYSQIEVIRL